MSANDQFNMGRLPLRPLSLNDKELAQTKELLIDNLGDDPSYHIYITDSKDRTRLIDLTNLYSENPNISGDNLTITIDGLIDPQKLKYIINFIYMNINESFYFWREKERGILTSQAYWIYLNLKKS